MGKLETVLQDKGLNVRERDVAALVSKGLSNKEVANQMTLTEKTIKFHLTNTYRKLGLKSRAQLIVMCLPFMGYQDDGVVIATPPVKI